ncbi:MAG: hypothetical protein H7838_05020 [Magnetococcus sp. DMHC-8]
MAILLRILLVCGGMVWLSSLPRPAHAFALGELQLHSRLNQSLQAMAPITLDPGEEIVAVDMGGNTDYQLLRLPRKTVVHDIQVQLKEQDGRMFVSLQSTAPVREKDFHVLLRVSSNHHTYFPFFRVRPTLGDREAGPANTEAAARPATSAQGVQTTASSPKGTGGTNRMYGPVRGREGLVDVARRFQKGTTLAVVQVEVAIWRHNQNKFIRNNMNGLKAGVKLAIPPPEEIARIDLQEAKELRLSHAVEWKKSPKERSMAAMPSPAPAPAVLPTGQDDAARAAPGGSVPTGEPVPDLAKTPPVKAPSRDQAKDQPREPAKAQPKDLARVPPKGGNGEAGKGGDPEPVKVESGTLQAILTQLQVITRVLENHHERQEQLEKRVDILEKNQEQQEQLGKRVSALEQSMKEWNFLTKDRGPDSGNSKEAGVPIAVSPKVKP